ncbi:SDR family NAD(P)-dependent oxidoreductase [Propionibacterium australiense]|uniref:Glucose 1-dehydrogenase n=1 Tax=Propionibacterium australiense TaxID=119981 RepID=A0A383S5J7_9ACTN|nr:glucose 1-dehydrogenase [Propionibacterium australiense]RLP09721.1 glucose 1-dehydrogenase [Propionibacterium australiense]RLP10222.1 glucose 1-dehydrogenase [Propionibacterium australiense]SYZ33187.1 Short-chain dehydrogenase/reductase, conserved site [Propionibacterium australiense]VEH89368.1 3-oxoacyl-[acyl-carrier-protein] reductase FabG [Propionibacterium australiense]
MSVLDKFSLDGKVAIVTGGNRGIGFGIAKAFVEAGGHVVVAARSDERNALAVQELNTVGPGTASAVRTDVSSTDSVEIMVRTVLADHGSIDVLVNDAGIGFHAEALTLPEQDWDRVFDTNLKGVWRCCRAAGRHMTDRGSGSIVNIGSMSGFIINRPQWHSPYGISKAAVHHLTKSLAAEWARFHVRVNAIAPGYVKTEIADIDSPEYKRYWIDEVPMQRYATPDEISPMALYLASDASTFTTGSVFVVDGGYTLW